MKKFSIITINFNNKEGLRKTLDSVVCQTFTDYELIVIDGGSTDGGAALLEEYGKYITFGVSEPDKGVYNAQNKGVQHASGEYCIFMNSGDLFYSNDVLECVAKELKDGVDIAVGNTYFYKNESENRYAYAPEYITLWRVYIGINHQSAFIKRQLLLDNPYDETYKISADFKFWLQELVLKERSYIHIKKVVAQYDMNGISSLEYKRLEEVHNVMTEFLPYPIVREYEERYSKPTDRFHSFMNGIDKESVSAKIIYVFAKIIKKIVG
ncbi:MAG: glycosyltransferase [Bacteroidaceae bacterium]|nr:glycosyltransferase [Bacteroidaceae bacterium]